MKWVGVVTLLVLFGVLPGFAQERAIVDGWETQIEENRHATSDPLLGSPRELEAFFDGLMASQLRQFHTPGAVVAVVENDQILLAKGYGYGDFEKRVPVDPEKTLFRVGSVTKLFVATAVMQLVEQGRLDLDRDIQDYLDYPIPTTLHSGEVVEPITMRHLLSHTPGFEDQLIGLFVFSLDDLGSLRDYLKENIPARVFPPGQIGACSNYGMCLAAYIVERIAEMDFATYVENHIFQPLAMERSSLRQPLPPELSQDLSNGYFYRQGEYRVGGFEWNQGYPAGSLSSSGMDMARFMLAHLDVRSLGQEGVLEPASLRTMHSQLYRPHPQLLGMAYGFMEGEQNGIRYIEHGGDTMQFHSGLFLLPEQSVGLFISYNGAASGPARDAVFQAFMDRFFPLEPRPDLEPNLPQDLAAQYGGVFHHSRSNFTSLEYILTILQQVSVGIDEQGYLSVQSMGERRQYVQLEPGLFIDRTGERRMAVVYDEAGQLTKILPEGPLSAFALIRSPWYTSLRFLSFVVGGGILFYLLSIWVFLRFLLKNRRMRRQATPVWPVLTGIFTTIMFALLLVQLMAIIADFQPDYGVPRVVFDGLPRWNGLLVFGAMFALLGLITAPAMIIVWMKGSWSFFGKLHYTLFFLWTGVLVWIVHHLNFLRI